MPYDREPSCMSVLQVDPQGRGKGIVRFPIEVYTLGRFELVREGVPVQFSGRSPQKPLSMLKAIINFGKKEVSGEHIIEALWPEVDGDVAHISFDTTLHRLRRLLGNKQIIQLRDGRLVLNDRYCWTDVWAFDDAAARLDALSIMHAGNETSQRLKRCLAEVFDLYRGHYLSDDNSYWAISFRERVRSRFILCVVRAGLYFETADEWECALECFTKGLERDATAEEFYQQLMVCYQKMGQENRAIAIYNLCRSTLSTAFGLVPSTRTEDIYSSLRSKR